MAALGLPDPFACLAEIERFKLFVTTTFDGSLAAAINAVRFNGLPRTDVRSFAPKRVKDLPGPLESADGPDRVPPPRPHLADRGLRRHRGRRARVRPLAAAVAARNALHRAGSEGSAGDRMPLSGLAGALDPAAGASDAAALSERPHGVRRRHRRARGSDADRVPAHVQDADRGVRAERAGGIRQRAARAVGQRAAARAGAPAAPLPPKGAIFISYAGEDRAVAEVLAQTLKEAKLDAWLDREQIMGGDHFAERIVAGIRRSELFIPCCRATAWRARSGTSGRNGPPPSTRPPACRARWSSSFPSSSTTALPRKSCRQDADSRGIRGQWSRAGVRRRRESPLPQEPGGMRRPWIDPNRHRAGGQAWMPTTRGRDRRRSGETPVSSSGATARAMG